MSITKTLGIVPLLLLSLILSGSAFGAILYVPDQYKTIQDGINAANEGDEVVIRDGVYSGVGNAGVNFENTRNFTVRSENGPYKCIIDGQWKSKGFNLHAAESITVQGLTFVYCEDHAIYADTTGSILIDNCIIKKTSGTGLYYNYDNSPNIANSVISENDVGMFFHACKNVEIINTHIVNNRSTGIATNACYPLTLRDSMIVNNGHISKPTKGGGLALNATDLTMTNTVVSNNMASAYGGGIYYESSCINILNATIANNVASIGSGLYAYWHSSGNMYNTIVWGNTFRSNVTASDYITYVYYSDIEGGPEYCCGITVGEGNIKVDPLFVGYGSFDYHLKPTSLCINSGSNDVPNIPQKDIEQNHRITQGRVDMGAYEYSSQASRSSFKVSPAGGRNPLEVSFINLTKGGNSSFLWRFGDGATSSEKNPSHTYLLAGSYTAELTTESNGVFYSKSKVASVNVKESAPVADFKTNRVSGKAPLKVVFANTSTGSIKRYAWAFGDGARSAKENPVHVYKSTGVYGVSLTVSGPGGSDTKGCTIQVD